MKFYVSLWIILFRAVCLALPNKNEKQRSQVHSRWWSSSFNPSATPTTEPTFPVAPQLSVSSSVPTIIPTATTTVDPTALPTFNPTALPTFNPTALPTFNPTALPTVNPTAPPTVNPTAPPTVNPTAPPTVNPTAPPTVNPTAPPTVNPTAPPTFDPTVASSAIPSLQSSLLPSETPTVVPTFPVAPQLSVSSQPTVAPTAAVTTAPSVSPPSGGTIFEIVILTITLDGVSYDSQTGLLTASGGTVTGTIDGLPFSTNIVNFSLQLTQPSSLQQIGGNPCAILNLELGPIYVNLLGLRIDTSPICLVITSFPGGLLGNILCDIASGNLGQLQDLLDLLKDILNFTLNQQQLAQDSIYGLDNSVCSGDCPVVNIVIGPVSLNLLGLNIELDNCNNGPVRLCVSATAGEGLLGDLLCGLTDGTFPIIPNTLTT